MALAGGTRLLTYDIVGLLGTGGMGEVYRASDLRLGRDVAIKVLPNDVASDPERLARFEHEARIVAGLNHPNIITLYSIEESEDTRFITMELVEGRSLGDLVKAGPRPIAETLDLLIPIADALAAAHGKGVVHRDLKPANVMLTHEGRVKVLDFGLAKLVRDREQAPRDAETVTAPMSTAGQVVGTVPYMAPEQIVGDAVDARTDLFAFGILGFEVLTGTRPFAGRTSGETTGAILHQSAPPVSSIRADVPFALEQIIGRCLEKRPDRRFQTAPEVAHSLRDVRRTLDYGQEMPAPDSSEQLASIAVLPFVNRSADADDEYFSDGLADELLGLLAKIKGLRVSARASSFQFKGTRTSPADIGRALGVATLLDGTVRRAGNRVRINVQLVKVSDGYHLWSESYDRTLEDIFAVQDDIAQCVVRELRATLLGGAPDSDAGGRAKAEVHRAARGRSTDPEAYRLYLLARHFMDRMTRDATVQAIVYLNEALARDPGFALAWAELSVAYVRETGWLLVPVAAGYERARQAVARALSLEPDLAEGHAQVASIKLFHDWDWPGAEAALARALELAPGSASTLRLSGVLASIMGRTADAIEIYRRALDSDPLSAAACHSLGLALYARGDFQGAEDAFRKALALAPQRISSHAQLALTALAQGRHEDALAAATREPEEGFRLWALALVHRARGDDALTQQALRQLIDTHAEGWGVQVAEVLAVSDDLDGAFEWLARAHATRDPGLAHLKTNPRLRGLHGDARWGAFLGRMGFAD